MAETLWKDHSYTEALCQILKKYIDFYNINQNFMDLFF